EVGLAQLVARIGDPVRERTVVGEQQQALAVVVQAPGRIHARRQPELRQRPPRRHAAVGELAQDVEGLVEGEEHSCSRARSSKACNSGARNGLPCACRARGIHVCVASGYGWAGFTNRSVILSLSPIAWYFASSASSWLLPGGRVHTPLGWSLVSRGLALTSLFASRVKPAASAIAIICFPTM